MNGKYKVGISFNKELLQSLKNDENSGVELKRSQYHLCIHPIQLNNFSKSIKQVLNQGIAKYNKDLEGILLGFEKTQLLSREGYIHNDSCYIHLDIKADFYVFTPEIGKEMKGIVNRKSKDHLGLLLYNALNVSILKPKDNEEWIGEFVDIGCEVLFKITYFSLTSFMPYIRGEVISVLTDVSTITKTNIDDTGKKQKPKKRKQVDPIEEVSKSKRKKVDNSSTDEPEHGSIKKYSKSFISDIDQSPSDVANNNSSKQKSKGHEDSSIQNSTGYTTFEENLLENADIVEETEEKKSKKYKQIKRRSSETTVVPSIAQRNSMFSSVDSPLMKIVGDDSTTLNADSEDLTSTFKIETLKEKNKTKVKKDKRKSIALLEKDISDEAYLEDTQLKVTVKEEKPSTKKNKSKKHDKSIESTTFNIPIMIKEEPTLDDIPVKKKSKKHKDKSHEDEA